MHVPAYSLTLAVVVDRAVGHCLGASLLARRSNDAVSASADRRLWAFYSDRAHRSAITNSCAPHAQNAFHMFRRSGIVPGETVVGTTVCRKRIG